MRYMIYEDRARHDTEHADSAMQGIRQAARPVAKVAMAAAERSQGFQAPRRLHRCYLADVIRDLIAYIDTIYKVR